MKQSTWVDVGWDTKKVGIESLGELQSIRYRGLCDNRNINPGLVHDDRLVRLYQANGVNRQMIIAQAVLLRILQAKQYSVRS